MLRTIWNANVVVKHKNKDNYVANHKNNKKMRYLSARTRANEDAKHKNNCN